MKMKRKRKYREKKTCSAAKTKQKTYQKIKKERNKFIQKMKRRIIINKHDNCNQFLNSYDKNRKCFEFDLQN